MPAASEPNLEAAARQLRAMLNIVRDPLFAVLDGAHFDDLEDELADLGISSRSLFLKGGDERCGVTGHGWYRWRTGVYARISKSLR